MRNKEFIIHLLGALLVISTLHHSTTIYSLFSILPFILVSISVKSNEDKILVPSLILATVMSGFFVTAGSMNEIYSLLIFSLTLCIPLFFYWVIALADKNEINFKAATISISYVFITLSVFYLLPEILTISEFIMSPDNRVPQTLMLFGVGMVVAIPFHLFVKFRKVSKKNHL